jgi:hypothetical protein
VSDSATGTIASLEHALDSIEDCLRERETDLTQTHRQSTDLAAQLDQPFEHEEKLAAATQRQQEIIAALDITKNQASAAADENPVNDRIDRTEGSHRAVSTLRAHLAV